jgi:hypothetical protein
MSRVYVDACSIIYLVEGVQLFQQAIKTKLRKAKQTRHLAS